MPTAILEISKLCAFKFYESTATPGRHFDDDWAHVQIMDHERKVRYYQKCQKSDIYVIQAISTFQPVFRLRSCGGGIEPTTEGNLTLITTDPISNAGLYEGTIDLSGVVDGYYYPTIEASFLDVKFVAIAEPIWVKAAHANTSVFRFTNTLNDFGVVFSGTTQGGQPYNPSFIFRCEAAVMDYEPDGERSSYRDQVLDTTTLSATPARKFKLNVGDAPGVAPWVVDLLNRIYACDKVEIDNLGAGKFLQYDRPEGAKWEVTRAKGYPLIGASVDLVESRNRSSLQLASEVIPGGGIVVTWDIETDAFGTPNAPASTNPVQIETIDE